MEIETGVRIDNPSRHWATLNDYRIAELVLHGEGGTPEEATQELFLQTNQLITNLVDCMLKKARKE